jgi:hypothetical protein
MGATFVRRSIYWKLDDPGPSSRVSPSGLMGPLVPLRAYSASTQPTAETGVRESFATHLPDVFALRFPWVSVTARGYTPGTTRDVAVALFGA